MHRGCIGAAGLKRRFNGETQTFLTELPGQFQQFDHLLFRFACRGASSMTSRCDRSCLATDQPAVAAPGDASRPGHLVSVRAHRVNAHIALAGDARSIAVACHTATLMPQFDKTRIHLGLHLRSSLQRHRVAVRENFDATKTVYGRKARPCQIHSFRCQRKQMLSLP